MFALGLSMMDYGDDTATDQVAFFVCVNENLVNYGRSILRYQNIVLKAETKVIDLFHNIVYTIIDLINFYIN